MATSKKTPHHSQSPPAPAAANRLEETTRLVAAAKEGRAHAWPGLYRLFRPASINFCKTTLGDEHLAQDAFHESILEASAKLTELRHNEAFTFWFRRILIKQCDRIIRKNRHPPVDGVERQSRAPLTTEPQVAVEINELGKKLEDSVNALPEPDRSLCRGFYLDRQSYEELSRESGLPLTTVRNRLYRARRILRNSLAGWQGNQPTMLRRAA